MSAYARGRAMLPDPARTWEERQARFRAFDNGVFNILKIAIVDPQWSAALLARAEYDIRLTMSPEAKSEMLCYTNEIVITVTGREWKTGWPFCKKTLHRHLTAEITFEPYCSRLSVWTDPKEPDGLVCFKSCLSG